MLDILTTHTKWVRSIPIGKITQLFKIKTLPSFQKAMSFQVPSFMVFLASSERFALKERPPKHSGEY